MKTVSIFGSTGVIGRKTIDILLRNLTEYQIEILTANSNVKLLAEQARLLSARKVVIADDRLYLSLKNLLSDTNIKVSSGYKELLEASSTYVDYVMVAIIGVVALVPVMNLIEAGVKVLALANKESIVCAGHLLLNAAIENNVKIIPVDSEHNAIFQIFHHQNVNEISKVTITASGGPFLGKDYKQMPNVKLSDVLNHPIWQMGKKILVDSATMINKSLEVIEAYYLFNIPVEKIDIIVHPESIIHAMISYLDGNFFALMSMPDMSIPISYTLFWPNRMINKNESVNLLLKNKLTFMEPNYNTFPALKLGFEILKSSKVSVNSIIFNAANEVAVQHFLQCKIKFVDIVTIVYKTLENVFFDNADSLSSVLECDKVSRSCAMNIIHQLQK